MTQGTRTAGRSSSSTSCSTAVPNTGENVCPICLESIKGKAYLDRCFHSFCLTCITRWINALARKHSQPLHSISCPICKCHRSTVADGMTAHFQKENISFVHALGGDRFRRLYVKDDPEKSFFSSGHLFRWRCYSSDPGKVYDKYDVLLFWKQYSHTMKNAWLTDWVERDMQMLTQEKDVDVIMHHVLGTMYSFFERPGRSSYTPEQKQEQFKQLLFEAAQPFLQEWTQRFVDELELFMASGLNIKAYDEVYMQLMVLPHPASQGHTDETTNRTPMMGIFDEDVD